ncbi:hypothetical protein HF086_018063 [Spodoptera exigua]|uniref:Uncharacterized protein n=1 Tax=Spodoptera exigua TaxID=7107 RepID=A0A922SJ52_SPOEX|nr:hypothetical protein HF086_018063 [Spodoptera exigua]
MAVVAGWESGSEVDVMDGAGNTALQIVCGGTTIRENTVEIARLLLEKKAYPLRREDSNESAWMLVKKKPELRELMKAYVNMEYMDEDDIKSEPDDDFESADEGDSRDDISSKSLAMILEDMGQTEAANVIRRYID